MARTFNPNDFGKGQNCLMYALNGFVESPSDSHHIFKQHFIKCNGDGQLAFEEMCKQIKLRYRKVKQLNDANLAISSFLRTEYQKDYEGILQPVRAYHDYHVIRKTKSGIWTEKNNGFIDCPPSQVPDDELAQWRIGSTPDLQIAYYAI